MPSKILFLWATCGGKAAARGPQKGISGEAKPLPNPHRVSRVTKRKSRRKGLDIRPNMEYYHFDVNVKVV